MDVPEEPRDPREGVPVHEAAERRDGERPVDLALRLLGDGHQGLNSGGVPDHPDREGGRAADVAPPPVAFGQELDQDGPRPCDIRWSTYFLDDIPRKQLQHPTYCVVQVNNVFNNPVEEGQDRWVKFPHPQIVFQYYNGLTGKLLYAESILAK